MKSMHAHELYSKQLQKTMDQDFQDLLEYEAQQYDAGSTRKVQPAYMQGDMFEEKKIESELKRQQQYVLDRRQGRGEIR